MADKSLADTCEIVMGQSPPGDVCNTSGIGLPLLNGPTEYGPHHPSPVQFTTDVRKRARAGDILFCVRGSTTGRMNWADQEYAIGRGVAAIRHKSNPDLQPFVRAVIEYHLPDLLARATGSTFPNVSAEQLARVPWPECEEREQRAIAHILGTLDDKIELNRRMSETLEAMTRALFKSWFVDFDPVRAKWGRGTARRAPTNRVPANGAPTGWQWPQHILDLFPDRLVDSELGEIPEGWEIGTLADVAELLREQINPLEFPDTRFRHFSIPAFDEGQWPKDEFGVTIKSQKSRVLPGVVLLSKLNPEIERVWLVDVEHDDQAVCSTEFLVLRPVAPFGRAFVYCLARSHLFRQNIEGLVTGTSKSHQRAQVRSILALPVVLPSLTVTQAFEQQAEILLMRSLRCRRESRTLAALRDALLPKLISGALRVKDAERFLKERGL